MINKLNTTDALIYLLGGNSISTFLNTNTNNRFTFRVNENIINNIHYVSVLVAPDVYKYIGYIKNQQFNHSKKSTISENSQSVKVFSYVFSKILDESLPEFIEIYHTGRCGKCGKRLTVPSSIHSGFGPECIKNLNNYRKKLPCKLNSHGNF